MKNFKQNLNELQQLFQKMGIDKKDMKEDLNLDFKRSELRELELELSTKGREIELKDLDISSDSTLEYEGKKVILYMRDQYIDPSSTSNRKYKFHISWCDALKQMKADGRMARYVISTRRDGIFLVNEFNMYTKKLIRENVETKLEVCVNCLGELAYKGFNYEEARYNGAVYANVKRFNIKEFFKKYDSNFGVETDKLYSSGVSPLNMYGNNWRSISRNYRESQNWICEKCGKKMESNKSELEVHHIDRNKFNVSRKNLIALCKRCHEKEHENDY